MNNWVEIRREIFLWLKCEGIQGNEHALRCLCTSVNSFCLRLNTHTHTCTRAFFKTIRSIVLIALEMLNWLLKCSKSLKIMVKKTLYYGTILLQNLQFCLFCTVSTPSTHTPSFKFKKTYCLKLLYHWNEGTWAHGPLVVHLIYKLSF